MKFLQIEKCSDSLMWYREKVGKLVKFVREDHDTFWSRDTGGYLNIVKLEDAKVVEVECCNNNCNQGRNCPLK